MYLKSTQAGFDGWSAIGRYPVGDWNNGISETYQYVTYYEVRFTTSYVYDFTSFDAAWTNATSEYVVGSGSNWTTSYSGTVGLGNAIHVTPTKTSGYNYQQLVKIDFVNALSGSQYKSNYYYWSGQTYLQTLSTPSVSFSQTTNEFTVSNYVGGTARCVEFNRDSYTPYSDYLSTTEVDICYNAAVRNYEYGIWDGQAQQAMDFALWDVGTYTVKLTYDSGHPSGTRSRFSDAVDNWIWEMNTAIYGSGVSFTRNDNDSTPDILVETKSNSAMGSTSNYTNAGLWDNSTNSDGWIYYAHIRLNYETTYYDGMWTTVEAIAIEELTQACGCGGDLTTRADCLNTDFNYYGKSDGYFNTIDSNIQNFLYNSDIYLAVGTDSEDLAVMMNPSNGFTWTSGTVADAYWMVEDVTYNMRVWQANSSEQYSPVPAYSQTFTPINYPTTPGSPTISSRFQGGYNLSWTTGSYADYYKLGYSTDNVNWSYVDNISSNSYSFYGNNGQTYYLKVRSVSNQMKPSSSYSSVNEGTTQPGKPTSITGVQVSGTHTVDVNYSKGYSGSGYMVTTDIDWTKTNGTWGSIEFTNQSGTFYNIDVTDFTTTYFRLRSQITVSGSTLYSDWATVITVTLVNRPTNWAWTTTITVGTNVPSVSGKTIYIMPASEWNAFTAKINDFRIYKGLTNYSFTSVSTNTEFTKTIINQALIAIRAMNAYFTGGNTVPSDRATGDNILQASVYQNMRDAMNSIT